MLQPRMDQDRRHGDQACSTSNQGQSSSSVDERKVEGKFCEERDQDHEGNESEVEDEAQDPVTRKAPKGPTKEEREKHEATHLPFREWCDH